MAGVPKHSMVIPSTSITLYENVPLDPAHNNCLTFPSPEAQKSFFDGYTREALTFDMQSYQRPFRGSLKLRANAEDLYNVNYLSFANKEYGKPPTNNPLDINVGVSPEGVPQIYKYYTYPSGWDGDNFPDKVRTFYAFVTSAEYIANATVEIKYVIDVMQTYLFDFTVNPCFVTRMHINANADSIGATQTEENVAHGDLICQANQIVYLSQNGRETEEQYKYCLLAGSSDANDRQDLISSAALHIYNNVFCGLQNVETFSDELSMIARLNEFIENGKTANIVSLYQYPAFINNSRDVTNITPTLSGTLFNVNSVTDYIDGAQVSYTFRNKKLGQYPFNRLIVSNNSGTTIELKYELFRSLTSGSAPPFGLAGSIVPKPSVMLYPKNYGGINNNYEHGLLINDFPVCAFNGDSFKQWWAQNITSGAFGVQLMGNMVAGAAAPIAAAHLGSAAAATALTAGAPFIGMAAAAATTAAHALSQGLKARAMPDSIQGELYAQSLLAGQKRNNYTLYRYSIRYSFAVRLDRYFDKFGYAINNIVEPIGYSQVGSGSFNRRPYWNYIQTNGCTIKGGVPANFAQEICAIFDRGVTFWHNPSECPVGAYSEALATANHANANPT